MGENPCYTYWVAKCKTPGCGTIVLDVVGPCQRGRLLYLPQCEPFEVTCGACMHTHTLLRPDVFYEDNFRAPTSADSSSSFRDAIRPPRHPAV
jgi:hypothetical protein